MKTQKKYFFILLMAIMAIGFGCEEDELSNQPKVISIKTNWFDQSVNRGYTFIDYYSYNSDGLVSIIEREFIPARSCTNKYEFGYYDDKISYYGYYVTCENSTGSDVYNYSYTDNILTSIREEYSGTGIYDYSRDYTDYKFNGDPKKGNGTVEFKLKYTHYSSPYYYYYNFSYNLKYENGNLNEYTQIDSSNTNNNVPIFRSKSKIIYTYDNKLNPLNCRYFETFHQPYFGRSPGFCKNNVTSYKYYLDDVLYTEENYVLSYSGDKITRWSYSEGLTYSIMEYEY